MIDWLPLRDFLTIGAAVLGAGLGIMNTWSAISKNRVRVRVSPAHAIAVPHGEDMFSIEVTNLSTFPLTLCEVGFTDDSNTIKKRNRIAAIDPLLLDKKPWPRRLESRESVSVFFKPSFHELRAKRMGLGKAYARFQCGEVAYGDSPALQQLREAIA